MFTFAARLACENARSGVGSFMVPIHLVKHFILASLLVLSALPTTGIAAVGEACGQVDEACLTSCKRFKETDPRHSACNKFCRPLTKDCVDVASTREQSITAPSADALTSEPPSEEPRAEDSVVASSQPEVSQPEVSPSPGPSQSPEPSQSNESPSASAESPAAESQPSEAQPAEAQVAESPSVEPQRDELAQATPEPIPAPIPEPTPELKPTKPLPKVASLSVKREMMKELEKNADMLAAIKAGNLNAIRRLIESGGLSPTYVYGYEYNPQTRLFEGRVTRLRLSDLFADTNTLRNDAAGLDRMLALFIELGMDVKATLIVTEPASGAKQGTARQREVTAWGPSLKTMELARDREARLRAFEMALQAGLLPNEDFGQWLFAELPQVCGRDRSKFSIQVVDLLIKYLLPSLGPPWGPSLQDHFWRLGEHGPETISDVLDWATAPAQPKNAYEKAQFALLDDMWEQCVPLSRRVNRFLIQGN
jgi:hypothetical protein